MTSKAKMYNSIADRFKSLKLTTVLEILMLLSLVVVWVVWPLRGTIAARNIALVLGAISSIGWLYTVKPKFEIVDFIPIAFLICVPVWLLGLYIFNPAAPYLQREELRGTWLRVILALFFAIGLGRLYSYRLQYRSMFLWVLFIWPIVMLILFILQGAFTHSWFGEQIYIYVFKSKVAGVYFLIWSLILCFSSSYLGCLEENNKSDLLKSLTHKDIALVILFVICIVDFFSLRSLNGLIAVFVGLSILTIFYVRKNKNNLFKVIILFAGIAAFISTVVVHDLRYSSGKLLRLKDDINFIVNHDMTGAWKWNGTYKGPYPPINTISDHPVNGSTYERVAWFKEGLKYLQAHPLGLGYTGQAFAFYMAKNHLGSGATKTHSGWLDFALGSGCVGMISVWLSMGVIFWRARKVIKNSATNDPMPAYICWSLCILFLLWLIAELSDREYIEHFFFMLVFFSMTINHPKSSSLLK